MANFNNEATKKLFEAILGLESVEDCSAFFEDLCTIKEIQDMSQRFETAIMLSKGYSYQKIAGEVGVSTATISRVNRCLVYGANGYRAAIDRMNETEKTDADK